MEDELTREVAFVCVFVDSSNEETGFTKRNSVN